MKAKESMLVVFSHGRESGPWGRKISAMADIARQAGAQVVSVDYRREPSDASVDAGREVEAERRVAMLLAEPLPDSDRTILVGSSMGGYVSTVCAMRRPVQGLFLLAPAFYLEGYPVQEFPGELPATAIVHGWRDEVVPYQNSIRFASQHRCDLHLVDGDHRLESNLDMIGFLLGRFLEDRLRAR